jgi:hypothetical protein
MTIRGALALLSLAAAFLLGTPSAHAATTDPLSFDDPGMHFRPPDGWERVPILNKDGEAPAADYGGPAAVWVFDRGKADQRIIEITIKRYQGSLDELEHETESTMRNGTDGLFIDKHELTKLENGMPAYWMRTSEGSDIGKYFRRYQYIVYDGQRSIIVALVGHQGDFEEKDAKAALSSLYVVAYPGPRP